MPVLCVYIFLIEFVYLTPRHDTRPEDCALREMCHDEMCSSAVSLIALLGFQSVDMSRLSVVAYVVVLYVCVCAYFRGSLKCEYTHSIKTNMNH